MGQCFQSHAEVMQYAMELARRGIGRVEPNPAVGAVLVDSQLNLVGEGFHRAFGAPHAEAAVLASSAPLPADAILFVTLEPCCHHGKTPPCTEAVIAAGIRHVKVGMTDPSPHADGQGIDRLRAAGVDVDVGLLEDDVRRLNAPFLKLVTTGTPYVHAKWAMTLDGKIAAHTGASRWISNEASRRIVHQLRGRMDAILIGSGTARQDDPLLTARPPGPRVATRVVLDSQARLAPSSQLVRTASHAPVLLLASTSAPDSAVIPLEERGVEVLRLPVAGPDSSGLDLHAALAELGRRKMTNVLVEGGSALLGAFFDAGLIDEVHAFVGPKLVGGAKAPTPLGGIGLAAIPDRCQFGDISIRTLDSDVYVHAVAAHSE